MQYLTAVDQRVLRLQEISQPVELLESGIGVVLTVRRMAWHLDRDDVLGYALAIVRSERDPS